MRHASEALKEVVDSRCRLCGSHRNLQAHHIVRRSIKRVDHPDNLVVLCLSCHNDVHQKKVELGPVLTAKEGAMAVLIMGTVHAAHQMLYPLAYRKLTHRPGVAA